MKLATLKDGSRDGRLIVVDRDLGSAVMAGGGLRRLQDALDDWDRHRPTLEALSDRLASGKADGAFPLQTERLMAPLPRAYQWLDASGYMNHVELVRRARGADLPPDMYHDPIMYQGASDSFLAPTDPIAIADPEGWGADFEAEVVVVTGDCPLGAGRDRAAASILLVGLVNDVSLRGLIPAELKKGFGFIHGKPSSAFAPVFVTPDELGSAWDGAKLSLPLIVRLNGAEVGRPDAGTDLTFDFPALIAHAAKTRRLGAGTIVGSGTVSNRDRTAGVCCLAERRTIELLEEGGIRTPYLKPGDRVEIEMLDEAGRCVFGAIDQRVMLLPAAAEVAR
ncbi:fumarylacetoacetate hydrolase family protein [Azospirillum sp. RWY-5-1]|uniref:Fumarylacetoacetate hydrolase family protein n=1 Tax=Azospirillum oleiclasticum TaxID=2735135 RepID=A0ABX2TG14_9PROT|nr:fumarylacetoacetate hydrolase family protein [Azospirillum oleiclasticum]NYZ15833.1 fumarylacetoacetate hydrolase family protein [Azospirillum oleiclasticum]NYZ22103.1 fumarylacetoacetate hydrolase family protein [Azospirillum oleiclasticum]